MIVPLLDLKAQYAAIKDEIHRALDEVLESQQFINGPQVKQLESLIADHVGCAGAVGVSSGTDALIVALMALGIQHDPVKDSRQERPAEVITSPYTFFATAGSIWRVGARPVFVDIEPDTFNIDPALISAAITPATRAIMPVHLFGQTAEMDPILEIAAKHELHVIEDAAQAIGARYKGRMAGSMGTVGCFSFFPSKNLGGFGDGGMVTTQDPELAERMLQCRNHGAKPKYYHQWVGGNFRLDTLQAAGLLVKMKYLEQWAKGRRANAARYDELLGEVDEITTPRVRPANLSVYNQYVIRMPRRDACRDYLKEKGIGCEVYYPLSLHQQECFASLGHAPGDFPESARAAAESLALPVYPELTDEQICHVVDALKAFLAS